MRDLLIINPWFYMFKLGFKFFTKLLNVFIY